MGGSYSATRRLLESIEREGQGRLERMRKIHATDPTPALGERIADETAAHERRIGTLRREHERFRKLMELSDDELRAANSNGRLGPVLGDPKLVRKIMERRMGEAEYEDLVNGPDVKKGQ